MLIDRFRCSRVCGFFRQFLQRAFLIFLYSPQALFAARHVRPGEVNCPGVAVDQIARLPRQPSYLTDIGSNPGGGCAYLDRARAVAAKTVTFVVPFRPGAPMTVAVMLWLPAVIKVTPLVKVWEPASFAVK